MYRNQYDSDVTIWSPQGRLHQLEYAAEAVKQGSATVGICSTTHVVLAALKRAPYDLTDHQEKIFEVDSHFGVSIAGLLSDGRILARTMQAESADWRWDHSEPILLAVIEERMQLRLQKNTQYTGRRPFGVGLLLAGYDNKGPHLVKMEPTAEVVRCYAMSIGARSQSARTYLEKHLNEFADNSSDQLIVHALIALRESLTAEEQLTSTNSSIALVGKDTKFHKIDGADQAGYLEQMEQAPRTRVAAQAAAAAAAPPQDEPMEDGGDEPAAPVVDESAPGGD